MDTKTLEQIKDEYYGETGTPKRDRLESELAALRIGFKIRFARGKSLWSKRNWPKVYRQETYFYIEGWNWRENIPPLKTLFYIAERELEEKTKIEVQL